MQDIQLFAAHVITEFMLKGPAEPVFILFAQWKRFVAINLIWIAYVLYAGYTRGYYHDFAEFFLNDIGVIQCRR